jgi:hypothetical protein
MWYSENINPDSGPVSKGTIPVKIEIMRYILKKEDFDKAFEFAINYHLDPTKSSTSRTYGASRGFGGVMEAFLHGKIVEIGVTKLLNLLEPKKIFVPDFEIKENKKSKDEPDIVLIVENKKERTPKLFVEIKHVSENDRWVGLTAEQFQTLKNSSAAKDIFVVGAYIKNNNPGTNKMKDLVGSYLNAKFGSVFSKFAGIENIEVVVEFAISGEELDKSALLFKQGSLLYETEIFISAGSATNREFHKNKFTKIPHKAGSLDIYSMNNINQPDFLDKICYQGELEVYEKSNRKSKKRYLFCKSEVIIEHDILGRFVLEKDKLYLFNLTTLGRNSILDRNNIWIAKRNISCLQNKKILKSTQENLKRIAKDM